LISFTTVVTNSTVVTRMTTTTTNSSSTTTTKESLATTTEYLWLTLEELFQGCHKSLTISQWLDCPQHCKQRKNHIQQSTLAAPRCVQCNSHGFVEQLGKKLLCGNCYGLGTKPPKKKVDNDNCDGSPLETSNVGDCVGCHNLGLVWSQVQFSIQVPALSHDGDVLRFSTHFYAPSAVAQPQHFCVQVRAYRHPLYLPMTDLAVASTLKVYLEYHYPRTYSTVLPQLLRKDNLCCLLNKSLFGLSQDRQLCAVVVHWLSGEVIELVLPPKELHQNDDATHISVWCVAGLGWTNHSSSAQPHLQPLCATHPGHSPIETDPSGNLYVFLFGCIFGHTNAQNSASVRDDNDDAGAKPRKQYFLQRWQPQN
jgi:hypothetical protein